MKTEAEIEMMQTGATRTGRGKKVSFRDFRGSKACRHRDFRLLVSRRVR